jgi:signal transduction histidine kinase
MHKTELILILVIVTLIAFIFIIGVILFVFQYRKRKVLYNKEKEEIEKQHRLDILNTQVQIQQQTMQFIGQEIHDSVAQKLTLASIYTQRMEFESSSPGEREKLSGVNKIINDSLLELRQLSRNLTDNKLQNAALPELIKQECEQVNATGICNASYELDILPDISIALKSSLLRFVQEFIQNSIKHSGCKGIKIKLSVDNNKLAMQLEDDSKGFDIDGLKHKGIGLDSIRRRIQMLGGEYSFKGNAGKGVILNLKIPINEAND